MVDSGLGFFRVPYHPTSPPPVSGRRRQIDDEDDGESEGDEARKCQNCDHTQPLLEVEEESAGLQRLIQLGGAVADSA